MAVIRKAKVPEGFKEPNSPQQHNEGKETVVRAASPPASSSMYVRLVNGCSTYVTPQKEVFYARDGQSSIPRIYEIDAKDLSRLLAYKDDYGRRFFKQVVAPADGKVSQVQDIAKGRPMEDTPVTLIDRSADEEGGPLSNEGTGEIDTGAVRLQDRDGKPVGVTV